MSLYDYGLGTLAQYELTADRSARTRGALLCYTAQGLLILREFHGSEKKLEKQQELLMKLQENGINTDYFLRNNQESLVRKDLSGRNISGTIRSFVRYANLYGTKEHPMYLRKIIWQVWSSFLKGHSMQ